MHYVEEGDGPLVILLHGYPFLWYLWRHQIKALAAVGYRAIMAIAHTLLKIAYQVLKTGTPYTDLGADFYASRETPRPGRTT